MFGSIFLLTQWLQFVRGYSMLGGRRPHHPVRRRHGGGRAMSNKLVQRFGTKIVVTAGLSLVGLGLLSMTPIGVDTAYVQVMGSMLLMAFGMGLTMAPATDSVMGSLPPEGAGVGSAVNDTTRELWGAFGVAVIGSLVSSGATAPAVAPIAERVPGAAGEAVRRSLGGACGRWRHGSAVRRARRSLRGATRASAIRSARG